MSLRWLKAVTIPMILLMQALSYQRLIQVELAQTMAEQVRMMTAAPAQTTAAKILVAELEQQMVVGQVVLLVLQVLPGLPGLPGPLVLQAPLVLQVPNRSAYVNKAANWPPFFCN